jgi:FKBP-type peptidyl-prolyl cis-trans isomerase FkpA
MKNLVKYGICLSLALMPTSCAELMKKIPKDAKVEVSSMNEGEKFLMENKTKEGVVTTSSGLQYKVVTEGLGKKPRAWETVKVHYRGTLINGTEFDSSYKRNEPISFPLNQVISGWTEGLQLMSIGSKYILYIPSNLAYGSRGAGSDIPPDSALIFEVELLDIK